MVLIFLLITSLTGVLCQDLISPCPRSFTYEAKNPDEPDRWYGILTLLSDSDLSGTWIRLSLDKPCLQLGNWFGDVKTKDNKEFRIQNRHHEIKANTPSYVRFYVQYAPNEPPPQLVSFKLNARTVCPEESPTQFPSTVGQLITSNELATTQSSNSGSRSGPNFIHPGVGTLSNTNSDKDVSYLFQQTPPALGESCGTTIKQPRPLITHGQQTEEAEFPWHAALYHSIATDLKYACGASLISKQHVITSAHCVTKRTEESPLPADNIVIYLGKYYLKNWSRVGIQDRNVEKIFVHEKYNYQTFGYDLAILKLVKPVEITEYVRPVCLWNGPPALESVIGKIGTVVGWGLDQNGNLTETLRKAQMPIISQETCIYSFPDFFGRFTSPRTYCAGFVNGTTACAGDSGGGMVFPREGTGTNNPVWQLRGMVSISVASEKEFKCDSAHYIVFTDVAKYLDWIKNVLNV